MQEDKKYLFNPECSLTAMRTGQKAVVSAIKGCPSTLLQKLVSMGVVNGTEVTITQKGLFGSPITLEMIYKLNPLEPYVAIFRDLLYHNTFPETSSVVAALAWAIGTFGLGIVYFVKTEKRLAELI